MNKRFVFAFIISAFAVSAFAAAPHVYIGFTGIQTDGNAKYVDVQVGSDESNDAAKEMDIVVSITVQDKDGKTLCHKLTEVTYIKLRPAVRPLRFVMTYTRTKRDPALILASSDYKLFAKVVWRLSQGPYQGGTVTNSITYAFRTGGTPTCKSLMGYPGN